MPDFLNSIAERIVGAGLRSRGHNHSAQYPIGRWRCTVSNLEFARGFEVGGIYEAHYLPGSISIVISPYAGCPWTPSWDRSLDRFCYPADQLDFEFVGATKR
jgi:hypothetical protein